MHEKNQYFDYAVMCWFDFFFFIIPREWIRNTIEHTDRMINRRFISSVKFIGIYSLQLFEMKFNGGPVERIWAHVSIGTYEL